MKNENSAAATAVQVYNRRTGMIENETVLGDRFLRLAYLSPARPLFRLLFCRSAFLSRLMGWYCDSSLSRHKIPGAIQTLGIDMAECTQDAGTFACFNDFFTRRLRPDARPCAEDVNLLCSPADARVLVFPELQDDTLLLVKGAAFTMQNLLRFPKDWQDKADFSGGAALIARLCPADYHRYHYPAAGQTMCAWDISGRLDSVNPLALGLGLPVFTENRRRIAMLELERFGTVAFIEIGAFGVGGIVQTHDEDQPFARMQEKGYFKFGGSSIILVFKRGRVSFDKDLCEHSATGLETLVKAGETIGKACTP